MELSRKLSREIQGYARLLLAERKAAALLAADTTFLTTPEPALACK